ncbi:MAG: Hsp20/alpha crystallin family protein [Oligoflexia bacterium]|nr:Hsp20/alpha crystallin family protein [Oligoflexia bacterium]
MNTMSLVNTLFEDFMPRRASGLLSRGLEQASFWRPRVDLKEEKDRYLLNMDIPGLTEKEVKIEFRDGVLSVSGERKQEINEKHENDGDGDSYRYQERVFGRFERSFDFGNFINEDGIKANLKDGTITIDLPKKEQKKAKTISIN